MVDPTVNVAGAETGGAFDMKLGYSAVEPGATHCARADGAIDGGKQIAPGGMRAAGID